MKGVRKLATASIGYAAAVFSAHYLLPHDSLYEAAAIAVLAALLALLFKGNTRLRMILLALSLAIGFAGYRLHYDNTVAVCNRLNGKTLTVRAQVLDYPETMQYGKMVNVRLCGGNVPQVKALLFDYDHHLSRLHPGDVLEAEIKFRSADERYGEEDDSNIANGVYLIGNIGERFEITGHGKGITFVPQKLGKLLRDEIKSLFPSDSAPFMLALLTGDKSEYYKDEALYTSMSISGLSHIVAVSGMHVSFLVAFLQLIMGKNRRSSVACLALIWIFVLMSGSSPSAVRAGLMLSVCLMAPVFNRENDRMTSLSLALAVILAINPFAAGSVSLQLSFAAMAGIFIFASPIFNYLSGHTPELRRLPRLKKYLVGTLSSSLAVTVFSVPLIALHFGYVSLLAPIANILCLWAVSVLFVGGYAACLLGFVFRLGAAFLAKALSYLVRYLIWVVKFIAQLPFASLYTENVWIVGWLILTYLLFVICTVRRKKSHPFIAAGVSLLALVLCFVLTRQTMRNDAGTVGIMDVGNGQCIALTEREHTTVIDCGSSGTSVNAATEVSCYLHGRGRTEIDYLLLTHLHTDHADGAVRLMYMLRVNTLVLPKNAGENAAEGLLDAILTAAEENGVKVLYIDSDTVLNAGDMKLSVYAPFDKGNKNEHGIMLTASVGDKNLLVTGDVSQSTERKLVAAQELEDTDILIVGHHGSNNSTSEELLEEAKPALAVISVGYNSYGHPKPEVLERLDRCGTEILRTDLLGRIVIDAGD